MSKTEKKKTGPKLIGREKRKMIGVAMEPSLHAELREEAELSGDSISLTVCYAVEYFLEERRKNRAMMFGGSF